MSKKGTREELLKKQMESLQKGRYSNNFKDKYGEVITKSGKDIQLINIDKLIDANPDWNFFPRISEDKMLEMIFSILENGLFNPIIVWEQPDDKYMILSGHNRTEAYRRIINEYRDTTDFNENNYNKIPAIVYGETEIDEPKAKEIIIDTNYIQREEDKRLVPIIIKNRMNIVKNRKDKKGRTIEIVAEEMGLSKTKIYEDYTIANKLIDEIKELYYSGEITKKAILRLTWFDKEVQKWIFENYKDKISNETLLRLNRGYNRDIIHRVFTEEIERKDVVLRVSVPKELESEFLQMFDMWIKNKMLNSKN